MCVDKPTLTGSKTQKTQFYQTKIKTILNKTKKKGVFSVYSRPLLKKTIKIGLTISIIIVGSYFIAKPKVSSADFISLLSTVFKNKEIKPIEEIEQINKSSQTMAVLTATISPESATLGTGGQGVMQKQKSSSLTASSSSSTLSTSAKSLAYNDTIVDGVALVSEKQSFNSGVIGIDGYGNDRISLYTVHDGDTIEQIANMYGVTASTILWANDLKKGSVLKKDQVLVILPISGVKYTVKKGDTLAKIAKLYKSDQGELAAFNNIDEDQGLSVGEEIIIPDIEGALPENELNKQNTKGNSSNKASSKGGKDSSGYFTRPVIGGTRTQGIHGHNGIDIAANLGTPILAAASGKVIVSRSGGWGGGYGTYVVIQHSNGMQTLYGHLSSTSVSSGEIVQKGQVIGKMGNTGQSTGVHLHFEVRGGKNPF